MGSHIEDLVGTGAGKVAGSDVPHRVASATLGRKPCFRQPRHCRIDTLDLHTVYLEILPARQMQRSIAVGLRDFGRDAHLLGREDAGRQTSAQHEGSRFALFINPLRNAERLVARRRNLTPLKLPGQLPKLVQILRKALGQLVNAWVRHGFPSSPRMSAKKLAYLNPLSGEIATARPSCARPNSTAACTIAPVDGPTISASSRNSRLVIA